MSCFFLLLPHSAYWSYLMFFVFSVFFFVCLNFWHNWIALLICSERAKRVRDVKDICAVLPSHPWCGTPSSTAVFLHPILPVARRSPTNTAAELRLRPLTTGVSSYSLTLTRPWWTSAAMTLWLLWRLVESCPAGWRTPTVPAATMSTCSACWPTSPKRASPRQLFETQWRNSLPAQASPLWCISCSPTLQGTLKSFVFQTPTQSSSRRGWSTWASTRCFCTFSPTQLTLMVKDSCSFAPSTPMSACDARRTCAKRWWWGSTWTSVCERGADGRTRRCCTWAMGPMTFAHQSHCHRAI